MTPGESIAQLLESAAKDAGKDLKVSGTELADYIDDRVQAVALAVGEPDYEGTLQAARDNVYLKAAGVSFDQASALDQRLIGIVHGGIAVAVSALA